MTEWQSVLTAPFEDAEQCEIKHLTDMRRMQCENNDANACGGKKFDCRRIEVR
jgi:hypothetical protein